MSKKTSRTSGKSIEDFLKGKSEHTHELFEHFIQEFIKVGPVTVHPLKSMIAIATPAKRIAYITQFGKNFIHVVLPFEKPYPENLCFQKIAHVPGDDRQYNHHFRMCFKEDVNEEVVRFMKLGYGLFD